VKKNTKRERKRIFMICYLELIKITNNADD
jgi:hypothetical protein